MNATASTLLQLVREKRAVVGVIGLGYVGLPLLIEFVRKGFTGIGLDIDERKIRDIETGRSYIRHIPAQAVAALKGQRVTTDFSAARQADCLIICVPTPLTHHRDPDLQYIEATARAIGPHLRRGQLVSLESTTYPGTTEEVLIPILEQLSGLKAGVDFHVAFSPEREDPSNPDFRTATIPKVVGGFTPQCLAIAEALYGAVICKTVPVSSCRAAEATKLVENIFRCVNIAMVNELKVIFARMGIDIWEVVDAAKTKPFGFMPFYPGPGLGGHCIPIDPFYLTWKAREYGVATRFIELAGEINTGMPEYVVQNALLALNTRGKSMKGARVLLVGLAYKKNVDDDRESPTYVLWKLLVALGADVAYFDPYCPVIRPSREHADLAGKASVDWNQITAENFDLAIISTAHDSVDHQELVRRLPLVVDCRNACQPAANVVRS